MLQRSSSKSSANSIPASASSAASVLVQPNHELVLQHTESFLDAFHNADYNSTDQGESEAEEEDGEEVETDDEQVISQKSQKESKKDVVDPFNELLGNEQRFVKDMKNLAAALESVKAAIPKNKEQNIQIAITLNQYKSWYEEIAIYPFEALTAIDRKNNITEEMLKEEIKRKVIQLAEIIRSEKMIRHITYMSKIAKHYLTIMDFFINNNTLLVKTASKVNIDIVPFLRDYLIKPVQHLMRYQMTIEKALDSSGEDPHLKELLEAIGLKAKDFAELANSLSKDTTSSSNGDNDLYATIKKVRANLKRLSRDYLKVALAKAGGGPSALLSSTMSNQDPYLLELQNVISAAVTAYRDWYEDNKQWFYLLHHHGQTGQDTSENLRQKMLDATKLEDGKCLLYLHFKRHNARLNPHSLDTFIIHHIAGNENLKKWLFSDKETLPTQGLGFFTSKQSSSHASKSEITANLNKAKAEIIKRCAPG